MRQRENNETAYRKTSISTHSHSHNQVSCTAKTHWCWGTTAPSKLLACLAVQGQASLFSQWLQSYQQPHRPQIVHSLSVKNAFAEPNTWLQEQLQCPASVWYTPGTQRAHIWDSGALPQNWPYANHSLHSQYSELHSSFGSVSIILLEDRSAPQDVTWFCEE